MGYYTNFYLEIANEDELAPDTERRVAQFMVDEFDEFESWASSELNEMPRPLEVIVAWESMKWYSHRDDMMLLSEKFPECKFVLCGEGEEREDLWKEYYYNGGFQYAPAYITYEEPRWNDMMD